jgi:hypothetical protein
VKGEWEERFESHFGFWRGCVDGVVERYLDCGVLENGFARVRCAGCRKDMLVAFSCKGRGLCPSCGAKRAAETANRLREDVLEAVGHAQWVFTIPKMLRPYFLRHRDLLGDLCRAAWQTVREMMVAAAGEQIGPGMVAVIQTFGSTINFHPHVHALVSRGGWTKSGRWVPLPWVDPKAAELLFRHKVLALLRKAGLIDEQRIALLLSWKHTGFSVHNSVSVLPEDAAATERLVRYLMRAPVSQERLEIDPDLAEVRLRPKAGADDGRAENDIERLDPDEAVARIIAQIPEPRKHLIHSYGRYANAARAKRERDAAAAGDSPAATASAPPSVASEPDSAERKAARKRWANLIRHIYEVDPLVCPRCGAMMKIIAFINEPRVGAMMKIIAFINEPRVIRDILDSVRRSGTPSAAGSRHPPPPARLAADGVQ